MPSSGRASRIAPDSGTPLEVTGFEKTSSRKRLLPTVTSVRKLTPVPFATAATCGLIGSRVVAAMGPVLGDDLVVLRRAAGTRGNARQRLAERELALLLDGHRLCPQRAVHLVEQLRAHH